MEAIMAGSFASHAVGTIEPFYLNRKWTQCDDAVTQVHTQMLKVQNKIQVELHLKHLWGSGGEDLALNNTQVTGAFQTSHAHILQKVDKEKQ